MADAPQFSSDDADALSEYQPINRLALAALFFGIACLLAFIHPLLWSVPILTVVLALVALRKSATMDRPSGRILALTGLVFALLCGSCAVAWTVSTDLVLARQSRKCCETWLEMLRQGKLFEAHQLTLTYHDRLKTDDPIDEIYSGPIIDDEMLLVEMENDAAEDPMEATESRNRARIPASFASWRGAPPLNKLTTWGEGMKFRHARSLGSSRLGADALRAHHLYLVECVEGGVPQRIAIQMTVGREYFDGTAYWRIDSVTTYTEKL